MFAYTFGSSDSPSNVPKRCQVVALDVDAVQPSEIAAELRGGAPLPEPSLAEVAAILLDHLQELHAFYGEHMGVRIARKHLGWYSQAHPGAGAFRSRVNRAESAAEQLRLTGEHFAQLADGRRAA